MILPQIFHSEFGSFYRYSRVIGGQAVEVTLERDSGEDMHFSIAFTVDGVHDYCNSSCNKVAITKWLLKVFSQVKTYAWSLEANAWDEDGKGEYRIKIYQKLGFELSEDGIMYMDI